MIRVHALTVNGSGPVSPWVLATTFLHDLDGMLLLCCPRSLDFPANWLQMANCLTIGDVECRERERGGE